MSIPEQKSILVATDLSPASESAVAFAADIAEALHAGVILFHAISPIGFVDYGVFDDDTMRRAVDSRETVIEQKLAKSREELFPQHLNVVTRAVDGYPVPTICEVAEESNAELIVMGTHGRHPVMSFFVGSVVQGVRFRTSRPVVTVPRGSRGKGLDEVLKILCPVNFTDVAMRALERAAELAARLGAEIIALNLVEAEEMTETAEVARRLHEWIPDEIREISQLRVLVQRGNPAEEVVRYARAHDVDLIVIGAQHKRFVDTTVLGTTTERVTRHAPCAVMTVMAPDRSTGRPEQTEEEKELAGTTH